MIVRVKASVAHTEQPVTSRLPSPLGPVVILLMREMARPSLAQRSRSGMTIPRSREEDKRADIYGLN